MTGSDAAGSYPSVSVALPSQLLSLLPPEVDERRIAAYVPLPAGLDGGRGDCLLLLCGDQPVLLSRLGAGPYQVVALTPGRGALRIEGEWLLARSAGGEHFLPLSSWLDRELVGSFLRDLEMGAAAAPVPVIAAPTPQPSHTPSSTPSRSALLEALLGPAFAFLQALDARAPFAPRSTPMPLDLERIRQELAQATTAELTELTQLLRVGWGLPPGTGVPAARPEGQVEVRIAVYAGAQKINAIKTVRELSGLGLREAKDLVEGGGVVLSRVDADKAVEIERRLCADGMTPEVTPV